MLFVVLKSYILEVRFMIWSGKKKNSYNPYFSTYLLCDFG